MKTILPPIAPSRARTPRRAGRWLAPAVVAVLLPGLLLAGCERTPTKADYVDARVVVECAGRTGEAFTLCRLEVIKKYLPVPLEQMQRDFPAPVFEDRMGCS